MRFYLNAKFIYLQQRFIRRIGLGTFLLFTLWISGLAASSDLDLFFGADGTVVTDLGNNLNDRSYGVAVQSDGKVISVGYSINSTTREDFSVTRTNPDGSLDVTFSDDGKFTFDLDSTRTSARDDYARDVVIQPDGKILIAGETNSNSGGWNIALIRLNYDGSIDRGFGNRGKIITNLPNNRNDFAKAIVLQPDGKIIVAGYSNRLTTLNDFVLVRYLSDGTLDTNFNGTGIVTTDISTNQNDLAFDAALQSDGKIVVAGYTATASQANNFAVVRYNIDGSLDAAFGGNGKVTADIAAGSDDFARGVALQADGKIVAAGWSGSDYAVTRFNTTGTLDTTFSLDGLLTTNFGKNSVDNAKSVVVQPDGKIIAAGRSRSDFALARYNSDGTLDTTFANNGLFVRNEGGSSVNGAADGGNAVALAPDGKIFVSGDAYNSPQNYDFAIMRLNSNGTLDTGFDGADGMLSTDLNNASEDFGRAAVLQPDGRIIVAGSSNPVNGARVVALARYNSNGLLDSSFGNSGIVLTDIANTNSENATAVAVQANGKIVVAGETSITGDFLVIRYNSNGSLDTGFGAGGIVKTNLDGGDLARALVIQPDGKILVAGTTFYVNSKFAVVRYNIDGTLDTNFGVGGAVTVDFRTANATEESNSVILQPDGKIILAGLAPTSSTNDDFGLVRLNSDGSLDSSFDGDGKLTTDFLQNADAAKAAALQPDGKILVAGESYDISTSQDFAVARYNQNGSLDTTFGEGGKIRVHLGNTTGNDYGRAIALQSNGKILVGGVSGFIPNGEDFGLIRLNPNGTLDTNFGNGGKIITEFGDGARSVANAVLLQPDGKAVVAGWAAATLSFNADFAVARYNTNSTQIPFDFDGDKRADLSVFRPSNGSWYIQQSSGGNAAIAFGLMNDKTSPADYDGDGKTDAAVYRNGNWYLQRSTLGFASIGYGLIGDIPQPADYDGDGWAELAVFRPSSGVWYIYNLTTNQSLAVAFGQNGDKPAAADYDGDGKTDIAIFRPSSGQWWIQKSSTNSAVVYQFGSGADKPVQADYTGDGKADVAVWNPSSGNWYILRSEDQSYYAIPFGLSTDLPVPADYDGDGKADVSVFRPSTSTWYLLKSTTGFISTVYGENNDIPVPNSFIQ